LYLHSHWTSVWMAVRLLCVKNELSRVSASHPTVQSFAATLRDTVTRAYDRDWNASRDWPLLHLASISNRALTLYSKLLWVHPTLADTRDSSFFTHSRRTAIHTLVQWLWRYKWEKTYPSEDNEGVKWIQEDLKFPLQDQFRFPAPTARDPTMWSASVRRAYDAVSLPGWYSDKQPRPASTPAPTKKYY
jgi:hypothetical protein